MDKVLREATLLLSEYKPKEALDKLSGLQNKSEQSYRLIEECKKLLRQQLLYLLKEADETNDYNEIEHLLEDYERFLRKDKFYKSYHEKLEEEKRKQEEIDANFNRAMIIIFLLIAGLGMFTLLCVCL